MSKKEYVDKDQLFELIYPIGSIYLSAAAVSPADLFGIGEWEQIKDTFFLTSGSKSLGDTGGSETVSLTKNQMPAHAHTRGTMNITGNLTERPASSSAEILNSNSEGISGGAFKTILRGDSTQWKVAVQTSGDTTKTNNLHTFDASRSWTGETSTSGDGEAHNNMPPYLVINAWKRVN